MNKKSEEASQDPGTNNSDSLLNASGLQRLKDEMLPEEYADLGSRILQGASLETLTKYYLSLENYSVLKHLVLNETELSLIISKVADLIILKTHNKSKKDPENYYIDNLTNDLYKNYQKNKKVKLNPPLSGTSNYPSENT